MYTVDLEINLTLCLTLVYIIHTKMSTFRLNLPLWPKAYDLITVLLTFLCSMHMQNT